MRILIHCNEVGRSEHTKSVIHNCNFNIKYIPKLYVSYIIIQRVFLFLGIFNN